MIIEYSNSTFPDAEIVIEGFPFDKTSSFMPGSRLGPRYIRICTENIEWFSPYQNRSVGSIKICDLGDYEFKTQNHLKEITDEVLRIYQNKKTGIFLGGEHTITLLIVKALYQIFKGLSIIHLDAHADLRDEFGGEKISHATVMKRIGDLVGLENIYQFGVRSGTEGEFKKDKLYRFEVYKPLKNLVKRIKEPIYLTIDVDVLDCAQCPAVATPEPGGISFGELINSLLLLKDKRIIGADIVEYNPLVTSPWASGSVVAEILRELILVIARDFK